MIINAILNIGFMLISSIIDLLPASEGFPSEVHTAMAGLGGYTSMWNPILPMSTILQCITIVIAVDLAIFGYKTVKSIVTHIPYIGGQK